VVVIGERRWELGDGSWELGAGREDKLFDIQSKSAVGFDFAQPNGLRKSNM
jgi:hypothetical protein